MPVKTMPYVCPKPDFVEAGLWVDEHGKDHSDGAMVPDWDPGKTLKWTRRLKILAGSNLAESKIPEGSSISVITTWWSAGTGVREKGSEEFIKVGDDIPHEIEVTLVAPGTSLRRSVQLRTAVVLVARDARASLDTLAPMRKGSVLWSDQVTIVLEGKAPRFPVTAVDFSESGLGETNACWCLDWSPRSLDFPAMGSIRLWFNTRHETFHAAVASTAPTAADLAIRSALRFSIASEMLSYAFENVEELEHGDFEVGSTGRVFLDLIARLFPGQSAASVADMRSKDLARFSATLQARVRLFSRNSVNPLSI